MTDRYWFDSWPGIDLDLYHPVLDFYQTPYGGPESPDHTSIIPAEYLRAFDSVASDHAPYTTVSQNRGGIA